MANIYYGTSGTAANESIKQVIVPSITRNQNGINELNTGDLLVVLFENSNTATSPTIVIKNSDSSQEIVTTGDTGVPIKVQAIEVSLADIWVEGETKIFVYTKGQNNIYYFEMIGSVKGDNNTFGNVKIVDDGDIVGDNIALSPAGAKRLLDRTSGLILNWDTSFSQGGNNELLGVLSITKDEEVIAEGIPIYYPTVVIPEINYTNQLYNNGPKSDNTANNAVGAGNPFLTKYVPSNLTFYSTGDSSQHIGLQIGNRSGNSITDKYLIFELVDANDNTNIFSKGNITFSAAPDDGEDKHYIIMGGTKEGGRVGNTQIRGTLEVSDDSWFNAIHTSSIESTGAIKMNGHTLLFGRSRVIGVTVGQTTLEINNEPDLTKETPCVICTLQDTDVGAEYVTVAPNEHRFIIHFTKPVPTARNIRINYLLFHPSK